MTISSGCYAETIYILGVKRVNISRRLKIVLLLLGSLIVLQVATYLLFAHSKIPAIALHWTPEYKYTHLRRETTFSWVCLQVDQCKNLSERQKAKLLSLLNDKYDTVYEDMSDIPQNLIYRDSEGKWTGYDDGFVYAFDLDSHGPFWIRVSRGDNVANMGGSGGDHVYVWILGIWVKLYDGSMMVR